MKAHLFLDNGVLKVTTEQIPEKPVYSDTVQHPKYHWQVNEYERKEKRYNESLASIKQRATVVGNQDDAVKIALPGGDGVFRPTLFLSDFLYEIDCEIKYTNRVDVEVGREEFGKNTSGQYRVAILSPSVEQPESAEREPSQEELWRELAEIAFDDPSIHRLAIERLKSCYTITRKP